MIGQDKALKLIEKILLLMEEYVELASRPKSYGTEDKFYRLDIHLIHTIGKNPGINVTELAQLHKITKSAISQAVQKLEKRGLIHRYQVPENKKEVLLELTDRGRVAYKAHETFHLEIEKTFVEEMSGFSEQDACSVEKLIDLLERRAEKVRTLKSSTERP